MKNYLIVLFLLLNFCACKKSSLLYSKNCLECSFVTTSQSIKEELCDDTNSKEEMEAMKNKLQKQADALGIPLNCKTSTSTISSF